MNFPSSTEQESTEKPVPTNAHFYGIDQSSILRDTVPVREIFSHLDADNSSVRKNKRFSGMLGCIDEGQQGTSCD